MGIRKISLEDPPPMLYRLHPLHPTLFPDPELADDSGLLAIGGDLSSERLLAAYRAGIFPWYGEDQPLLWWSPNPRCVILPEAFRIPHTVRKELRKSRFTVTVDCAFVAVMQACSQTPRPGQDGTWIVDEMIEAYTRLHQAGFAHSVEVWEECEDEPRGDIEEKPRGSVVEKPGGSVVNGKRLAGGLYGVYLNRVFFGESMFHIRPHASKLALVRLMDWLRDRECVLVDCQMETAHIMRYGAELLPRTCFLKRLRKAMRERTFQDAVSALSS